MENYLNKSDILNLEIEELELLMGPEDPEVNLRYILAHASRKSCKFFERLSAGMEVCKKKQKIQNKEVERRLLGKNLRLVERVQPAASAKHAGRANGRRRHEEAPMNEGYERYDEK